MTLYDRILVPTDGSAEGKRAVAHALDLASVHGADVHALYVVDTASYAGMPMESSWEGVGDLLRDDAKEAVAEVESLAAETELGVETAVAEGSPSKEIIRYAEGNDCDLIVMGTHGRGGIDRLLLGSVAEKVVRGSSVPVLTVRLDGDVPGDAAVESEAPAESEVSAESEAPVDGEPEATGRS
ncbi:UspA domain protein [Halorubrum saccharovorum DSM 1137]|uniref:UspA domain protein n=1 Tax=Halorubrum saccharovorum DSM 1137 TaxID=1227484 RepID=M0E628_9EURY|nr:universal stress protein [Halorubrum saccharovorum]ELZ43255.1 UspA domain protein [Halorubrum saccharovorum DSM 1137]